jgi:hypothetical protein
MASSNCKDRPHSRQAHDPHSRQAHELHHPLVLEIIRTSCRRRCRAIPSPRGTSQAQYLEYVQLINSGGDFELPFRIGDM